jgi:hypothetical protein
MSVPDEGYSRNSWCGNNWIYTFVHVVTRVYFLLAGKCKPDCKHKKPNNLNGLWLMVFNATINNISDILVEETGVPGKSHRSVASH